MTGFCFKCKLVKEFLNPQEVVMKNGRKATKGECPDCKTKMFKINKKDA